MNYVKCMWLTHPLLPVFIFPLLAMGVSHPAMAFDSHLKLREGSRAQFKGLLQGWTVNDTTQWPERASFNFRIRRAEIGFMGSVLERFHWNVMIDPAKSISLNPASDNKILQDLGLRVSVSESLSITFGQLRVPSAYGGLVSAESLLLPERSLIGRTFGDRREPGLSLNYKLGILSLTSLFSNGQGPNVNDPTTSKDLSLRVDFEPHPFARLGLFTSMTDLSYRLKGTWGMNVHYSMDPITVDLEGAYSIKGEENAIGFSGELAYFILTSFQSVVRFEWLDPEGTSLDNSHSETLGVNYLFSQEVKLQGAAVLLHNLMGNYGIPSPSGKSGTLLVLSLSMAV